MVVPKLVKHIKMKNNKCNCGNGKDGICTTCSAYKMVFLLLPGWEHLKYSAPNGDLVNPVRYSYYRQNSKPTEKVVEAMLRRFSSSILYKQASRMIHVYENRPGGALVTEVKF